MSTELNVVDMILRWGRDGATKKGHLMLLIDANCNLWDKRWFVLRRYVLLICNEPASIYGLCRPYLHVYTHSNEVEDVGIIGLEGVKIEADAAMDNLFGVYTSDI